MPFLNVMIYPLFKREIFTDNAVITGFKAFAVSIFLGKVRLIFPPFQLLGRNLNPPVKKLRIPNGAVVLKRLLNKIPEHEHAL